MDYRQIGRVLASHLKQCSVVPSVAAMQGMIADLAADHPELLLPMRDLVTRPHFQGLIAKADSGGGALQRDALLNELRPLFSAQVLDALTQLLNGFLNIPSTPPSPNQEQAPETLRENSTYSPFSLPAPAVAKAGAPPLAPRKRRGFQWPVILLVAAFFAGAGAALRYPPMCGYVGLCIVSKDLKNVEQVLLSARRADQALRRSTTLEDYTLALQQLDGQLLKLSDMPLDEQQQMQRDELSAISKQAQTVLTAEKTDQQPVENAASALQTARQQSGDGRVNQLAVARRELAVIPPRSFAGAEASRLRQQLNQLEQATSETVPSPPGNRPEPGAVMPAPLPPSPPATDQIPYRDQPLF